MNKGGWQGDNIRSTRPAPNNPPKLPSRATRRISNSTLWLLILVGLLPSLISALVNTQSQQILLAKASRQLHVSADRLSESFAEHLDDAAAKLHALASSPLLANDRTSTQQKLSVLRSMKAGSNIFEELILIDADGTVLASTAAEPERLLPDAYRLEQQSKDPAEDYCLVKMGKVNPPGLMLRATVVGREDDHAPVLLGLAKIDVLAVEIQRFGLGYSGLAVLTGNDGYILAASVPELTGQNQAVLDQTVGSGDSGQAPQASAQTGGNYQIVSRSLSSSPASSNDSLRVLVAQTRAEILESSLKSSRWSLLTVMVITPIVLLLGLVFSGSVRHSLDSLIAGTRRIAQGDFTPLNVGKPYWEIGELAKSFEQMKTSLAESHQRLLQYQMGLENLVAQKTTQLRQSERKYRTLYESSRDALMLITPQREFISGNPAAVKIFALRSEHEFTSKTIDQCAPQHQPDGSLSSDKAQQMIDIALKEGSHFFDWICKRSDGTEFFSNILLTRIELDNQKLLQATVRDVTEDKRLQDILVEQAGIDQLTQLWNRRALLSHLDRSWSRRQRYGEEFSLIMIDIDHFKLLNDTHGHQAGDKALQLVAQTLVSQCREMDLAARYGGEEFAVALSNTDAVEAQNLAQRCRQQMEDTPFTFNGRTVKITASFGVADTRDLPSIEFLIQHADQALYLAKRAGRNRVELFTQPQSAT